MDVLLHLSNICGLGFVGFGTQSLVMANFLLECIRVVMFVL